MTNDTTKKVVMDFMGTLDVKPGTLTGTVFGAWDQSVVTKTKGMGAEFTFLTSTVGYIRTRPKLEDKPVIVHSQRMVKAGKFEDLKKAMQAVADHYYTTVPGV